LLLSFPSLPPVTPTSALTSVSFSALQDKGDAKFNEYFSKCPWLAIPFSDADSRLALRSKFNVSGIPTLSVLDTQAKTITREILVFDEEKQNFSIPYEYPFAEAKQQQQQKNASKKEAKSNKQVKCDKNGCRLVVCLLDMGFGGSLLFRLLC
jgi:hypothetical protein